MRSSTTPPVSSQHRVYCALPGAIRPRSLVRQALTNSAAPGPRTLALPRWLTSNRPTRSRTAVCSRTTPPPGYSIGISHPPKSAILAPRATWRSCSGEVNRCEVMSGNLPPAPSGYPRAVVARGPAHDRGPDPAHDTVGEPRPPCPSPTKWTPVTTLTVSDRPASDLKVDALVLATVKADSGAALAPGHGLPKAAGEHLTNALKALSAKGTPDEVLKLPAVPGVAAPLVVLTGLGAAPARGAWDHEVLRRAAGSATRALSGVAKVALPGADAAAVGAVSEGALYGAYAFAGHRSQPATSTPPSALTVLTGEARDKDVKAAVKRASALAEARA